MSQGRQYTITIHRILLYLESTRYLWDSALLAKVYFPLLLFVQKMQWKLHKYVYGVLNGFKISTG